VQHEDFRGGHPSCGILMGSGALVLV